MVIWELRTKLPDHGLVKIVGMAGPSNGTIVFLHPSDESIVFQATHERLEEILKMGSMEMSRLNIRLDRKEVYQGFDHRREPLDTLPCLHCGETVTWVDADFPLHALPYCDGWRMGQK